MLGQGVAGKVYKAESLEDKRIVALKVFENFGDDESQRKRIRREIRALMAVDHDHIVKLYDVGTAYRKDLGLSEGDDDKVVFLSMEYIKGESLAQKLQKDGRIPIVDACDIGIAVAKALRKMKEARILHRDIKPSNILISETQIKLSDFGIAKVYSEPGITKTGVLLGTPLYMPPEGYDNEWRFESDLYSLGATLYHAIVGKPPYCGLIPQVIRGHLYGNLQIPKNLPADISQILVKLLQKSRKNRYHSADRLISDLEKAKKATGQVKIYSNFEELLSEGKRKLAKRIQDHMLSYPYYTNKEGQSSLEISDNIIEDLRTRKAIHYKKTIWKAETLLSKFRVGKQKIKNYRVGKISHDDFGDYYLGIRKEDLDAKVFRRLPIAREDYPEDEWMQMINRIERGVDLVQWISSPQLLNVHDFSFFRHKEIKYYHFLLDYEPNLSLADLMTKENPSHEEKVYILYSIAKAITVFFEQNFVLRSITPEIIQIGLDGDVKLNDFSFTKFGGWREQRIEREPTSLWSKIKKILASPDVEEPKKKSKDQFHSLHKKIGNSLNMKASIKPNRLRYFSPELIHETPVDHRCDIWSLGAIAYELYAQEPLFDGNIRDIIMAISSTQISEVPHTEENISQIIRKALNTDVNKRYACIYDFMHDLEQCL